MKESTKKRNRISKKWRLIIASTTLVVIMVGVSQATAAYMRTQGNKASDSASSKIAAASVSTLDKQSILAYSTQLSAASPDLAKASKSFRISRMLSPFFVSRQELEATEGYAARIAVSAKLLSQMGQLYGLGDTNEATTGLKALIAESSKENIDFVTRYSYRQLGIVMFNLRKENDPSDEIISYFDKTLLGAPEGTTIAQIAADPSKYSDYKLYEMLDGRVLALYSYLVESDSDGYVKGQQTVELLNKFYGLLTKYNTPEQRAKIDEANKKLYAYAHFDLARIYYLQAKYEKSSEEITAAQAYGVDLGALDERYPTLLGLLAQRGQKPSQSRVASTARNNYRTSSATCSAIVDKMNGELSGLSTQINTQFDLMRQITNNASNLYSFQGGALRGDAQNQIMTQVRTQQLFNEAEAKSNTLISQYESTQTSYQNQLAGAGCATN